jgi:zinc/manganese transport system permease protein
MRALVVCLALSISTTALGVFLQLRRMSLMGDAFSRHFAGCRRGIFAQRHVAAGDEYRRFYRRNYRGAGGRSGQPTHAAERRCQLCRVLSGSLALGVTLVSLRGSNVDLLHLLFGSILAVDNDARCLSRACASSPDRAGCFIVGW